MATGSFIYFAVHFVALQGLQVYSMRRKVQFLFLLVLAVEILGCYPSYAQENFLADSLINSEIPVFEEAYSLHASVPEKIMADTLMAKIIPTVDIETVEDRIACLNLDMPIVVNKTVCGFIQFFTVRKRNYTQTMLERKNYYFPIFEYYLKKHGMPDALKYLSIVESGLNFKARSKTGAVGLWQFMPGTGKDFYLTQNQLIDERQNPYLATEAACKFLKYLYRLYGDWELALAAYNCGPGNVNKAIKKSGKRGFWEIYPFLPQETRSYVPQFHAVVYAMNFAAEHNIYPDVDSILVTHPLDTFHVAKSFDVFKLEAILGLPLHSLRHCNPTLRTHVFPAKEGFHLLVPTSHSFLLSANLDRYLDSAKIDRWPVDELNPKPKDSGHWIYFTARKGTELQEIAEKHQVSVHQLKKWNHLASNRIKKSTKLRMRRIGEEHPSLPGPTPESPVSQEHWVAKSNQGDFHLVEKGEKLYQIAMRYGKTTQELKKWNQLADARVSVGQKLWLKPNNEITNSSSDSIESNSVEPNCHTVKACEGLFAISRQYGLSLVQIREWNNLRTDELKEGQVLNLFPPQVSSSEVSAMDSSAGEILDRKVNKSTKASRNKSFRVQKMDVAKVYHVQKGDTLYSITRKFSRLSIKELIRLNKLKDKNIKPGQQLIIG